MKKHVYWIALLALSTTALPAQAQGVSREKWMEVMSTTLPDYLCGQNEYFRQCFKVSAQQCQQTALSATRTCLKQNESKIPAVLRSRDEGGKWGEVVGECTGNAYETALAAKRINSTRCNNVNNWIKPR